VKIGHCVEIPGGEVVHFPGAVAAFVDGRSDLELEPDRTWQLGAVCAGLAVQIVAELSVRSPRTSDVRSSSAHRVRDVAGAQH